MKKLDKNIVGVMSRRCLDVAGTTPKQCRVYLNKKLLDVKNFKDLVEFYAGGEDGDVQVVHERIGERWEVAMAVSDGQFKQVSFVNANATNKGGMQLKPYHVRNYIWLFVNCQIENPSF